MKDKDADDDENPGGTKIVGDKPGKPISVLSVTRPTKPTSVLSRTAVPV